MRARKLSAATRRAGRRVETKNSVRVLTVMLVLATAGALVSAAPAGATYVTGKQTVVNEKKGIFRMQGGLIGTWTITSFKVLKTKPVLKAKGTESFNGCLDVVHDGSCTGDPSGTLAFSFLYWAKTARDGKVELGTCAHPVTGGTGAFATARGFLMMVDTPAKKPPFIKTHYEGDINVAGVLSAEGHRAPRRC